MDGIRILRGAGSGARVVWVTTMRFKIATWNLNHWQRDADARSAARAFLEEHVQPDVALLQEAVPDEAWDQVISRVGGIGPKRPWGSAIVSFGPELAEITKTRNRYASNEVSLLRTWPGTVTVGDVHLSGARPITVVSMYGLIEDGYACTTVHRQLSDLTPLFDTRRGNRIVVGGDLNCSTQLEPPHGQRDRNVFERFELFGLVNLLERTRDRRTPPTNCPCADAPTCGHVQTHRHRQSTKPWQDDYLFASAPLADQLVDCYVIDSGDPDPWSLSDHCPVVAEFDLWLVLSALCKV